MRVEIVHHQGDSLGVGVLLCNLGYELSPILLGLALGDLDGPLPRQGLVGHEDVAHAVSFVLVVVACRPPWRAGNRGLHLADQLARRLVHADYRKPWRVRPFVDIEHLLHLGYELGVLLRRDDPAVPFPRLEFVFFRTRRIDS